MNQPDDNTGTGTNSLQQIVSAISNIVVSLGALALALRKGLKNLKAGTILGNPLNTAGALTRIGLGNNLGFSGSDIVLTSSAFPFVVVPYAATVALDLSTGVNFYILLTGNMTLDNPVNVAEGQVGKIVLQQDGVGSRLLTLGANFKTIAGAGVTLSTGANDFDMLEYTSYSATFIPLTIEKDFS